MNKNKTRQSSQQLKASRHGISGIHNPPKTDIQRFALNYTIAAIEALPKQSELIARWADALEEKFQEDLKANPKALECETVIASFIHDARDAVDCIDKAYNLLNKHIGA